MLNGDIPSGGPPLAVSPARHFRSALFKNTDLLVPRFELLE